MSESINKPIILEYSKNGPPMTTEDVVLNRLYGSLMHARSMHTMFPDVKQYQEASDWLEDMYKAIQDAGLNKIKF